MNSEFKRVKWIIVILLFTLITSIAIYHREYSAIVFFDPVLTSLIIGLCFVVFVYSIFGTIKLLFYRIKHVNIFFQTLIMIGILLLPYFIIVILGHVHENIQVKLRHLISFILIFGWNVFIPFVDEKFENI